MEYLVDRVEEDGERTPLPCLEHGFDGLAQLIEGPLAIRQRIAGSLPSLCVCSTAPGGGLQLLVQAGQQVKCVGGQGRGAEESNRHTARAGGRLLSTTAYQ